MVKNITLSADETLIEKARRRALREQTTLNQLFRRWLRQYSIQEEAGLRFAEVMQRLSYVSAGKRFSREDLNAR